MKRMSLFIFLFLSITEFVLFSQSNSLNIDFNDGKAQFIVSNSVAATPSYTIAVENGSLVINATKRAQDWSFLGLFGQSINISQLPTLQFKVKTNTDATFKVVIKAHTKSNPSGNLVNIEKSVSLLSTDDYKTFFFDLTDNLTANPDYDPKSVTEIQIDCNKGWNNTFTGIVSLDYIKIGLPKEVDAIGTGFVEDFNSSSVPAIVIQNPKYEFSSSSGSLSVSVDRDTRWYGFNIEFPGTYDLKSNPYLNLSLKSDKDMVLQVFLIDVNGNGYEIVLTGGGYQFDELNQIKSEYRKARVYKSKLFTTATFDFTGAPANKIDLTKILKIKIVSNGTAQTFEGKFYIDEIRLGDQAFKKAYIGQIDSKMYTKNTLGKIELYLPEISGAKELKVSNSNLIENTIVNPISYNTFSENGINVIYGNSKLSFNIKPNVSGKDTIVVKAIGNDGYMDNEIKIPIEIIENQPPTIETIEDIVIKTNTPTYINLKGIKNGDPESNQSITITATSSNTVVADAPTINYQSPNRYGILNLNAKAAGTTQIEVLVKDNEGSEKIVTFQVKAYASLNQPPKVENPPTQFMNNIPGTYNLTLKKISDGDNSNQTLTVGGTSNDTTIIKDIIAQYYTNTDSARIQYTLTGKNGNATITAFVADNGGNLENDGNKTTYVAIPFQILKPNPKGFTLDMNIDSTMGYLGPEGKLFNITRVDSAGGKILKIQYTDKWTYGGIFINLPYELDLSSTPVVSMDVYSVGSSTWHWNYFYDAFGRDGKVNRNIENTESHQLVAKPNQWTTLKFDYRQPGDMNNDQGSAIDASRINGLLLNLHNETPTWPFTNSSGTVYIKNIRLGDQSVHDPIKLYTTLDLVPGLSLFPNSGEQTIKLSGISNGAKGTSNISITATSSNNGIFEVISISPVNSDGTAIVTIKAVSIGFAALNVSVNSSNAETTTRTGLIRVISNDPVSRAKLTIDRKIKHQTMKGFGTFQFNPRFADLYSKDLSASVIRLGIISNQWEPVNDNSNPNIINMEGFNYEAFDWEYLRKLKANGVKYFIITSWSPPAWMKRNLSLDHREQAIAWENTDNILEPQYYSEFAESIVALIKAMKQEAGIDILAIGLQNEPYFNEPYPSAILSPSKFNELIKITSERFVSEGIQTGLYMPEQVFGDSNWGDYTVEGYLSALQKDAVADAQCKYFAVHGYDGTGIASGFPNYSNWGNLYNLAQATTNKKELWMSETHIKHEGWSSSLDLAGAIHGSLWAGNITLWTNWGFEDMQLTNNIPNSTFYASMNYFKYIRPEAVRVETKSNNANLMHTAFENTDGKLVVVVINKGSDPVSARFDGSNLPENYQIFRTSETEKFVNVGKSNLVSEAYIFPSSSITTLIAEPSSAIRIDQQKDTFVLKNASEVTLNLSGISNGEGNTTGLVLNVENSNNNLFSTFNLSSLNSNGTAQLTFKPSKDVSGGALVTVSVSNTLGESRKMVFVIKVNDNTSSNYNMAPKVNIYPNPAHKIVNIQFSNNQYSILEIRDISGKKIYSKNITTNSVSIPLNNWSKGMYIIDFTGKYGSLTEKLLIE